VRSASIAAIDLTFGACRDGDLRDGHPTPSSKGMEGRMFHEWMKNHDCGTPEPEVPASGWIAAWWDCETKEWMLTGMEIHPTREEATEQARMWGDPDNVMVQQIEWANWTTATNERAKGG
jgi:hypothetical protein